LSLGDAGGGERGGDGEGNKCFHNDHTLESVEFVVERFLGDGVVTVNQKNELVDLISG